MREIAKIREEIAACDEELARLLARRMDGIGEIIGYKKMHGLPVFQPGQEARQQKQLEGILGGNPYEEELLEVFACILRMSKKVQAKALFAHNIALIGFMGAGKSTVSHCLKDMLSMEEVETDAMVVESEGMAITDIFAKYGEPYFRNCESNAIIELQNRRQVIISCGGGAVMRDENVENLKKSSRIVLLTATPKTILERVKGSDERPILNGHMNEEYISELMEKRRKKYEEAADVVIATDDKPVIEICEELIRKLNGTDGDNGNQ
ncbi:shikimate kinase [Clostridiaceae bacterium]|nr:shikimate kinase [Clostridiaceae bacterium]RKI16835.1 shikimate kinase [bacterium 1XD21-70]